MKRYVVTLDEAERAELSEIKGSHLSQKVINALILLNCDEGAFNECQMTGKVIAEILRISMRKVDRVKKRFVEEGLEAALGGRQGRRPTYMRKADGVFEARLVALSCGEPPEGYAQWSLRLLADRVVELGYTVSHETVRRVLKKTASSHGSGWVIPPQGNADFAAAKVLDVYHRPAALPVVCMDETPRPARHGNRSPWRRDGQRVTTTSIDVAVPATSSWPRNP